MYMTLRRNPTELGLTPALASSSLHFMYKYRKLTLAKAVYIIFNLYSFKGSNEECVHAIGNTENVS